jgi:hypothetical protein
MPLFCYLLTSTLCMQISSKKQKCLLFRSFLSALFLLIQRRMACFNYSTVTYWLSHLPCRAPSSYRTSLTIKRCDQLLGPMRVQYITLFFTIKYLLTRVGQPSITVIIYDRNLKDLLLLYYY